MNLKFDGIQFVQYLVGFFVVIVQLGSDCTNNQNHSSKTIN